MSTSPNVIQIVVDDMGYGDLGLYNHGISSTPAIDSLFQESLRFSQAYAASPVCNPSRASLMTGRYPHRTGSVDTLEWRGLERLSLTETTAGEIFSQAGYHTGVIGKWHLGAFDKRYHPRSRGFDETVCFRGGMHDYYDWRLEYDYQVVRSDGRYLTDLWTDEAVAYLHRHQHEPFYLHLAYNAPHTPLQVPEVELRPFKSNQGVNASVATLYAMIKRMDNGIGRILETVRSLGLENNTIIMFTSDNGPQFDYGPKQGGSEANESLERYNCGLHGSKGSVWEGGIKVPLALRWPDGIPVNGTCDEMIHFVDILPTLLGLCDLTDISTKKAFDGIDFSGCCCHSFSPIQGRTRFWQWNRYSPVPGCNTAMRKGDWKLVIPEIPEAMEVFDGQHLKTSMYYPEYFIKNGIITDDLPPRELSEMRHPELYNIAEDPAEKNNLADGHRDTVSRMMNELNQWYTDVMYDFQMATEMK